MLARTTRRDGRDGVVCVVLGRGASTEKVDHWLRVAAPVEGSPSQPAPTPVPARTIRARCQGGVVDTFTTNQTSL